MQSTQEGQLAMVFRTILGAVAAIGLAGSFAGHAADRYADGAYAPPTAKSAGHASPIAAAAVEGYLSQLEASHVFTAFEGRNDLLKAQYLPAKEGPLQGGESEEVDLAGEALFGAPLAEDGARVWLGSVVSADAEAVRLRVDLSRLREGEAVYVIDPEGHRAFGPYDADDGETWLATVQGDEAVLLVRSPHEGIPPLRLTAYAHIFLTFREIAKELECNLDIACESNPALLEASSGVGIINVAGIIFCSGSLVNNGQTAELEPFFVTANHCLCSGEHTRNTEVFWDFRASSCGVDDAPLLADLPRSNGDALLATTTKLDATLIRLDHVPDGDYGRAYAGWDARAAQEDDAVLCVHHPEATRMRISKGAVTEIEQRHNGREHQVIVLWSEGVTENGSSGSALLFADTLRIAGMLSQGPVHSCTEPSGNFDWFASFHYFYPEIRQYIDSATPSTEEGQDDCRTTGTLCPFVIVFNDHPALLGRFRAFRDDVLLKTALGRPLADAYYRAAPAIGETVSRSAGARGLFVAIAGPLATVLGAVD